MAADSGTRGFGLLEGWLARQRARMADSLIPSALRTGRILDIGCGAYPHFLAGVDFAEKYGMDKATGACPGGIRVVQNDFMSGGAIPFPDAHFSAVTMLAVFEHVEPMLLAGLAAEVRRVLAPGGVWVITTPAAWTESLLRLMASLRLVSPVEIAEHKAAYTHAMIRDVLVRGGFAPDGIRTGYFECFLNNWALAEKS